MSTDPTVAALDAVERRIREQADGKKVGSMVWRAHFADLAHVEAVRRGLNVRGDTKSAPMTGPEHYEQAERMLELAGEALRDGGNNGSALTAALAGAQVHATLALAAATIDAQRIDNSGHLFYPHPGQPSGAA